MKTLIVSIGKTAVSRERSCDSSEFDRLRQAESACDIIPIEDKRISADGRQVYVGPGRAARQTAEQYFTDASITVEPLLDEIPQRSYKDTNKKLPLWLWRLMACLQQFFGIRRQPETKKQAKARAEKLIAQLEAQGRDCILVSYPGFIKVLLDRFQAHGYCIARSGVFGISPLERVLITKRDMHCGGCSHNCLLTNPGCGVGRDKARRHSS